jgi:hypothetical protein
MPSATGVSSVVAKFVGDGVLIYFGKIPEFA